MFWTTAPQAFCVFYPLPTLSKNFRTCAKESCVRSWIHGATVYCLFSKFLKSFGRDGWLHFDWGHGSIVYQWYSKMNLWGPTGTGINSLGSLCQLSALWDTIGCSLNPQVRLISDWVIRNVKIGTNDCRLSEMWHVSIMQFDVPRTVSEHVLPRNVSPVLPQKNLFSFEGFHIGGGSTFETLPCLRTQRMTTAFGPLVLWWKGTINFK